MEALKTCRFCGAQKPAIREHFNKKADGLTAQCRPCRSTARRCDQTGKARANEIRRERRAADPEAVRAAERAGYGERKRANVSAWRAANPDKVRDISRQHYRRHRSKIIDRAVAYAKANPDATKANARRLHQRRQAASPQYRLKRSIGTMVWMALKGRKAGQQWQALVGYALDDLMRHLERQFLPGMSWSNQGEWHVDHIIPASSFSYTEADDPEFKACWALTNLRPLWRGDNIRKRDRRLHLI